jgi:hypothetical protein
MPPRQLLFSYDTLNICLSGGMVDALDLGSSAPGVEVRVLSKAGESGCRGESPEPRWSFRILLVGRCPSG